MKITVEALTDNQKSLLCNGALAELERARLNHDLMDRIGFQAFQIASMALKVTGLMMADYSLTPRGHELFKELMNFDKPTKETAMPGEKYPHTEAEQSALGERILASQVVPQVCTDPMCLCHDMDNPHRAEVHTFKRKNDTQPTA